MKSAYVAVSDETIRPSAGPAHSRSLSYLNQRAESIRLLDATLDWLLHRHVNAGFQTQRVLPEESHDAALALSEFSRTRKIPYQGDTEMAKELSYSEASQPLKRGLVLRVTTSELPQARSIISEFRFVVAAPDGERIVVETPADVDTALIELERKKGQTTMRVFAERRLPLTA